MSFFSWKYILGAYGYCDKNCPLEKIKVERPRQIQKNFARLIDKTPRCLTISGPNPGKPCIFPFKYNGTIFNGCERDHEDRTKTWCSTKVDSKGNHIPNQNEYGHCGKNCPKQTQNQQSSTNQALSK